MNKFIAVIALLTAQNVIASELVYPRKAQTRGIEAVCFHDAGTVTCDVQGIFEDSVLNYAAENNLSNRTFCVAFSLGSKSCDTSTPKDNRSEDQYIAECADMIKQKYRWIYFDFRKYQFDYDGNRSVFFHVNGRSRSDGGIVYRTGVCNIDANKTELKISRR